MSKGRQRIEPALVGRELLPGQSTALLAELHLLSRDGSLNADSLRKLKQVNHLLRLLEPLLGDALSRYAAPLVVDCGAGKSYLGFLLYERFLRTDGAGGAGRGAIVAVESRADVVATGRRILDKLAYDRMQFAEQTIESYQPSDRVHVVTALHACDTATDDALALAITHNADHVAVVPCCQAEVARQLHEAGPRDGVVAPLYEHPWHRREFGSHLTNVVRCLVLEAHGYSVTVTELAGWEHSLKNELILGKKVRASSTPARQKLDALLAATGIAPKLVRLLGGGSRDATA